MRSAIGRLPKRAGKPSSTLPRAPTVGSRTRHAELEPGNARATLQCLPGRRGFLVVSPGSRCCQKLKTMNVHQPANSCANSPVLDFFRTIDSSSHLNSIPTYLATRLRTYEQVRRLPARHNRSSPGEIAPPWVRMHRQAYISGKRSAGPGSSRVGVPRQDSLLHDKTCCACSAWGLRCNHLLA